MGLKGPIWKAPTPPAHPSTQHAAGPGCWHHAAPAMDFWLRPVLINIFNYRMDALTGSARRAWQGEDGASAGAAGGGRGGAGSQPGTGAARGERVPRRSQTLAETQSKNPAEPKDAGLRWKRPPYAFLILVFPYLLRARGTKRGAVGSAPPPRAHWHHVSALG